MMRLLRVNVAEPAELLDDRTGRSLLSGIGKRQISSPSVMVRTTNIDGDGQGDLQAHGGVDKAVYCYPHDHLPAWEDEIGYGNGLDAPFGENLSVKGLVETDVRIGDQWQWGDCLLEVAQPRWPCFKLGLHSDHRDLPARLIQSERSGWYCRVVQEGEAPTHGTLELVDRDPSAPTVREAFRAAKPGHDPDAAIAIADHPVLASRWRDMIRKRYTATEGVAP